MYYVIVGSFTDRNNAYNMKADMVSFGFIDTRVVIHKGMHYVSPASFVNEEMARKYEPILKEWGIGCFIKKMETKDIAY